MYLRVSPVRRTSRLGGLVALGAVIPAALEDRLASLSSVSARGLSIPGLENMGERARGLLADTAGLPSSAAKSLFVGKTEQQIDRFEEAKMAALRAAYVAPVAPASAPASSSDLPRTQVRNEPTLQQRTQLFVDALGSAASSTVVANVWSGALAFFRDVPNTPEKGASVQRVAQAKGAALARLKAVQAPASLSKRLPASAPKQSPGGGPLDTAARDQAIFDLASGRQVDLSIGPSGLQRDYGSQGVSSKAVAGVALALAGVATIVLLAVVLRPRN